MNLRCRNVFFFLSLAHHWKKHSRHRASIVFGQLRNFSFICCFSHRQSRTASITSEPLKALKLRWFWWCLLQVSKMNSSFVLRSRGHSILKIATEHCKQNPITILIFDVFFSFKKRKVFSVFQSGYRRLCQYRMQHSAHQRAFFTGCFPTPCFY